MEAAAGAALGAVLAGRQQQRRCRIPLGYARLGAAAVPALADYSGSQPRPDTAAWRTSRHGRLSWPAAAAKGPLRCGSIPDGYVVHGMPGAWVEARSARPRRGGAGFGHSRCCGSWC